MPTAPGPAHLPQQVPIDAYGNGGFRFGGMSHRGSLLCLPDGMHGWHPTGAASLKADDFALVLQDRLVPVLLLGTGAKQVFPDRALREAFAAAGIGLEAMDTGAACRTYNVLLAEKRSVAAALIAVA